MRSPSINKGRMVSNHYLPFLITALEVIEMHEGASRARINLSIYLSARERNENRGMSGASRRAPPKCPSPPLER